MNETATTQQERFVAYLVGEDVCILNNKGVCIASSNTNRIGSQFEINKNNLKRSNLEYSDQEKITILYDQNKYSLKELKFVKSLARLALQQYMTTISKPSDSLDQFISDIADGIQNEEQILALENKAPTFAFDLTIPRTTILIEITNFAKENLAQAITINYSREEIIDDWKKKISSAVSGFFTGSNEVIVAYIGNDRFLCIKEVKGDWQKFVRLMKSAYLSIFGPLIDTQTHIKVAFSELHQGIQGLHEAYHEANQALQIGQKIGQDKNKIYFYGDLGTLRIITEKDINKKKNAAKEVLQPLDKVTLRSTLETFLNENMDIKTTAKKLRIHPNTVNYRLGKVADNLGLDPRIFKQAFELRIALLTDKLFPQD